MKYLGVDWGLRRIGLAFSEGELADPCRTLTVRGFAQAIGEVAAEARRQQADKIVIGHPEGEMGKVTEKVARELRRRGLIAILVDETLSTQTARQAMVESGAGKKARRDDNAVAAAIILQRFLDERNRE